MSTFWRPVSGIGGAKQAAVILGVAVLCAVAANMLRAHGLPWRASWSPEAVAAHYAQDVRTISLDDAWELFQGGDAVFLDARTPDVFDAEHIPGALNIVPEEASVYADEVRLLAAQGMTLITYCDGLECPLGSALARELKSHGVSSVRVMVEGWAAWTDAGYPVEGGGS